MKSKLATALGLKQLLIGVAGFITFGFAGLSALQGTDIQTVQPQNWPVYSRGSSGEDVYSIQYMLRQKGYSLTVNGQFDEGTEQAIKRFQQRNLLSADGTVNGQTWTKLVTSIQFVRQGDAVTALQRQLKEYNTQVTINSRFDTSTQNTIKKFQEEQQLTQNGFAGLAVWSKLVGDGGPYQLRGRPTVNAELINRVLEQNHSPAAGSGQAFYDLGVRYGIDPVFALAFFKHESSFGTAGVARHTKSIGNIRCTAGYICYNSSSSGAYRQYTTWEAGVEDWYKLIRDKYVNGRRLSTVDKIIPVYAPASENNVSLYISSVKDYVDGWRADRL